MNDAGDNAGNGPRQQYREGSGCEDRNSSLPMRDDPHHHAAADTENDEAHHGPGENRRKHGSQEVAHQIFR
jgi:hypothetical protein